MAERLGTGLQNRLLRFESGRDLKKASWKHGAFFVWYKVYEMITFHIHSLAYLDFVGQPFKYAKMFEQQIPDIFGFSYSGETFPIQLELDLKQVLLLKDQYPLTAPFIHYINKKNCYELKVQVNNLLPIERFIKGVE